VIGEHAGDVTRLTPPGAAPGISFSVSSTGAITPKAFWWQWPCTWIGCVAGRSAGAKRPARASRAKSGKATPDVQS
jgi:hypothetical protein